LRLAEWLKPSKYEALSSNPNVAKAKQQKTEKQVIYFSSLSLSLSY
jgi:hypothetical protein